MLTGLPMLTRSTELHFLNYVQGAPYGIKYTDGWLGKRSATPVGQRLTLTRQNPGPGLVPAIGVLRKYFLVFLKSFLLAKLRRRIARNSGSGVT